MKTALIVDSACSLPAAIRQKYDVFFVPLDYVVDDESFVDSCEIEDNLALFESGALSRKHEVYTHAPSTERFEEAIVEAINDGYDCIIVQTVNRTQGVTYENANSAVARVKQQIGGREITLRVMDSRTVFAGQAVMATETLRRLIKTQDERIVRRQMDKISETIQTFILPKDPLVALERSRDRNENSVGWTQAMVANVVGIHPIICNSNDSSEAVAKVWGFKKAAQKIFAHIENCIDAGVTSPIISVHVVGEVSMLEDLPGYTEMVLKAKSKKLMVIPTVASVAAGVYTSVGSISVAIASTERDWTM